VTTYGLNRKKLLPMVPCGRAAGAEIDADSSIPLVKGCFDNAGLLIVSSGKGEFHALIPKGAGFASRLSSTRDYVAAFSAPALDG